MSTQLRETVLRSITEKHAERYAEVDDMFLFEHTKAAAEFGARAAFEAVEHYLLEILEMLDDAKYELTKAQLRRLRDIEAEVLYE